MVKKILLFTLLCFFFACQRAEIMDRETLKAKMSTDPTYLKYKALNFKQDEMIAMGEFEYTSDKQIKVHEALKGKKDYDDIVSAYERAGVKNAKVYVDLLFNKETLYLRLKKKYPLFAQMSSDERFDFVKEIGLYDTPLDVKRIYNARKNNQSLK